MELCVGGAVMPQGWGLTTQSLFRWCNSCLRGVGPSLHGGMAGMAAPDPENAFWRLWQQASDGGLRRLDVNTS